MSGIHCGRHLPFGLLDVSSGFNVDMFKTRQERAEAAIRATWPDMPSPVRIAWLRTLANTLEAEARAEADSIARVGYQNDRNTGE